MTRHDFLKLIAGGSVSVGLAAVVFGPLGFGLRYTDQLERRARTALEVRNLLHVDVAVVRSPALQRDLVLSGKTDPARRDMALNIVRGVPGAADVRWAPGVGAAAGSSGISVRY